MDQNLEAGSGVRLLNSRLSPTQVSVLLASSSFRRAERGRVGQIPQRVSVASSDFEVAIAILIFHAHRLHAAAGAGLKTDDKSDTEAEGGKEEICDHKRNESMVVVPDAIQPSRVGGGLRLMFPTIALPAAFCHQPRADSVVRFAPTTWPSQPVGRIRANPPDPRQGAFQRKRSWGR